MILFILQSVGSSDRTIVKLWKRLFNNKYKRKNNKIMIHIKSKKEHYQFLIICTLIKASIFFKIIPDRILHISIKQILITK